MKILSIRIAQVVAKIALAMTTLIINTTCHYIIYQEPLPEKARRLRKF